MARYNDAIEWIAKNDDTSDIKDELYIPNVSMSLVADLWDKTEAEVIADVKRALKSIKRRHPFFGGGGQ